MKGHIHQKTLSQSKKNVEMLCLRIVSVTDNRCHQKQRKGKSHSATDTIQHNDQTYHDDRLLQKMNREKFDLMSPTDKGCYHSKDRIMTEKK